MENYRKYCRIAAIIEIITGLILHSSLIYLIIMIILAAVSLSLASKSDEEILNSRKSNTILVVVTFILNLIAGIFMIIASDAITDYEKKVNSINSPPNKKIIIKKKVVDPEIKKIDILLKLGVGMVFVSGLLFATTSWDFISNMTKAIALVILGTLFICLSKFSEDKLKLYNSTFMYWILGMSFYLLTIVGMLYFGIAGDYLKYQGEGVYLAYAITCFTTAGLALATYLKFSLKSCLYVIYTSILLMCTCILFGVNLTQILIVIIIIISSLLINIFNKSENSLSKFNIVISYAIIGFTLASQEISNCYLFLAACLFNVVNLGYLSLVKKDSSMSIVNIVISYYLMVISIGKLDLSDNIKSIIIFIIPTIYTLLLKFNILNVNNKGYKYLNYCLYSLLTIGVSIVSTENGYALPLIIIGIYFIVNYISKLNILNTEEISIAKIVEPLIIFLITVYIFGLTDINVEASTELVAVSLIYSFILLILKDEKEKLIYKIASYISIILYFLFAIGESATAKLPTIAIIVPCAVLFIKSLVSNPEKKAANIFAYILTLYSIYNVLYVTDIFEIGKIISSILFIWVLVMSIYLIKEDYLDKTTYFIIALPIYNIVEAFNSNEILCTITSSLLALYITFLIVKFFCSDEKSKDVMSIIGIIISVLFAIESSGLIIALYIGVIGIVTIIIGYYKKNSKALFITGIVITVVNIIIQLYEFWEQVPFWLYLLIGGLGIIFFVTYREVKKMNKK